MPDIKTTNEGSVFLSPLAAAIKASAGNDGVVVDIFSRVDKLPPSLQKIMFDNESLLPLEQTLSPDKLLPDLLYKVPFIIGSVLLGDLYVGDLPKKIQDECSCDRAVSEEIANAIVANLFQPVINDIKQIQQQKFPERIKGGPANNQPVQSRPAPSPGLGQAIDPIIASQRSAAPSAPQQFKRPEPQATPQMPSRPQPVEQARPEFPERASPQPGAQRPPLPGPAPSSPLGGRQFKMPPPLASEPRANEETGKILNLKELEK